MANLTSQLVVRLIDQVSGPATKAGAALRGLVASSTSKLNASLAANARALDQAQTKLLTAAGSAVALGAALGRPIGIASEFQATLLDIAQKADLTDAAMKALGDRFQTLSKQLGTSTTELAKGFDSLVGAGLDPVKALAALPIMSKVATAYRSTLDDVSRASFSVISNLGVPIEQLAQALDTMAQAGKSGSFELADLARELAGLTPAAASLGLTGVKGLASLSAMLEVARKGAGSSAEAANNVNNFMMKALSPDSVKKFKSFGIDIRKEFKKTLREGGDVIEKFAELVDKATGGDRTKIGDLFQDQQVRAALLPLLADLDEYRKIRDDALRANGVVEKDFARRAETSASAMARFGAAIERLQIALGSALLPALNAVLAKLSPLIDGVTSFVNANPELVASLASIATGLTAVSVASAAAGFAILSLQRGALLAARAILVSLGPVGWAMAGIGAAGVWIANNWTSISVAMEAFKGAFDRAIAPIKPALQPVIDAFGWLYEKVSSLLGPMRTVNDEWARFGLAAGAAVGDLVVKVSALPGQIASAFAALPGQMYAIGSQIVQSLIDGIVARISDLLAVVNRVQNTLAGLGINAPQPAGMAPAGTSTGRAPPLPKRAAGGPVNAGQTYLVGERGPELFRSNVSGSIAPNHALGRSTNVTVHANFVVHATDSVDGVRKAVAHIREEIAQAFRGVQADTGLAMV